MLREHARELVETVRLSFVRTFQCNICGTRNAFPAEGLGREDQSCRTCCSTVRMRAVVHVLSQELFGSSLTLAAFPCRKDLVGIGLSDWDVYAKELAARFDYTNTFFDAEPRLDVTRVDPARASSADFLIASDVFEHVAPPVARAFDGAARLLTPGGLLVFTVPYVIDRDDTREHFPELHEFQLVAREDGQRVLVNTTADGRRQEFEDLVFHGGDGMTLEMRVFTRTDLLRHLERSGFVDVKIHALPEPRYGILWRDAWSLPLSARKRQ